MAFDEEKARSYADGCREIVQRRAIGLDFSETIPSSETDTAWLWSLYTLGPLLRLLNKKHTPKRVIHGIALQSRLCLSNFIIKFIVRHTKGRGSHLRGRPVPGQWRNCRTALLLQG